MRVLLVASDKGELKGFDDRFIKVVSGVGLIMASSTASFAISEHKPDIVLSIGSAGAINSGLQIGEAYSFSTIVTPDQNLTAFHVALGSTLDSNRTTVGAISTFDRASGLTLGSSSTFYRELQTWHSLLHIDASDMEAYGVGIAAQRARLPFYAVKLITDRVIADRVCATAGTNDSSGDSSGTATTVGDIEFNLRTARGKLIDTVTRIVFK